MAETPGGEYNVEDITRHRVNSETLVAEFFVKWEGYTKDKNTWEPLDNVYKCPVVLQDLEKKKRAALVRRHKDNPAELEKVGNFELLDQTILDKFNDPEEFIPRGNESAPVIMYEIKSKAGNYLWATVFSEDNLPCFVRKSIVAYYWPCHAALFLTTQVGRAPKIMRAEGKLRKIQKSKK